MATVNFVIIAIILIILSIGITVFLKRSYSLETEDFINKYSFDYLAKEMKDTLQLLIKLRTEELNLNKFETEKRIKNKERLKQALRNSSTGDYGAKTYVKDYIVNLLQEKYGINENTIDKVFNSYDLKPEEQFLFLLYQYKKEYRLKALEELILQNQLDQPKYDEYENPYYEISEADIWKVYQVQRKDYTYLDKLDILTQRIYASIFGHGVVDEIRDMKIDGVSGGVSGISQEFYNYGEDLINGIDTYLFSYDSVWIFFQGKSIRLSFLGFGSQMELERVCKNIYRYNNPGQLSEEKGHIENDMKDGSRVVVVRPPFSDSWAFIVRKHDNIKDAELEEIITDKNSNLVIDALKCMVKGCQITAITGEQGCGKTTLLKVLIRFINSTFNLRIQELIFELSLRKLYPNRNILTFKEIPSVSGQEGLDLQKKTDGAVNIMGEVSTFPVANWIIQMSQVASKFTMFTHHAKTVEDLIEWMRNALMKESGFHNEKLAEEQVVKKIRFDIHLNMNMQGHRYIERITEIIPLKREQEFGDTYKAVDIIRNQGYGYELENKFSNQAKKEMFRYLSESDKVKYANLFEGGAYE